MLREEIHFHFSKNRSHITAINIRKDENGFLHATIADSLKKDPSELQMVLDAIKHNNERAKARKCTELANILAMGQNLNAQQTELLDSLADFKPESYAQHVTTHEQTVTNSCGFHAVVNLYALNQNPNITNVSQFGEKLEEELSQHKDKSVALDTLGNAIKTKLEGGDIEI